MDTFTTIIERLSQVRTDTETQSTFIDGCRALESALTTELPEEVVNEGVRSIIAFSSVDGLPINDVLKLWKIYLHFLKQHQHQISTSFSEKIVLLLLKNISEGLEISFLDSMQHFTDSATLARKVQLLLFFCQRLFTTVVYLSPNLSNGAIRQSYEKLLLCRGVCFVLGKRFRDQTAITSKLSKFDTLFSNSLELQPSSQMHHPVEELQRRQQLYHATVKSLCLAPCESVHHRYIVLGVFSYSCIALPLDELLSVEKEKDEKEGESASVPLLALLLQLLQEIIWAAECLNTCFCGEVDDKVGRCKSRC